MIKPPGRDTATCWTLLCFFVTSQTSACVEATFGKQKARKANARSRKAPTAREGSASPSRFEPARRETPVSSGCQRARCPCCSAARTNTDDTSCDLTSVTSQICTYYYYYYKKQMRNKEPADDKWRNDVLPCRVMSGPDTCTVDMTHSAHPAESLITRLFCDSESL